MGVTRRTALGLIAGAAMVAAPGMALARRIEDTSLPIDPSGGEWRERFDATSRNLTTLLNSRSPVMGAEAQYNIQRALARYQGIANAGGWGLVPDGQNLRLGMSHSNVEALRRRLIASGDLDPAAGVSRTFDSYVDAAVRRFQQRHGLLPNGVVDQMTVSAMNVPVEERIGQLQLNLLRLNAMGADHGVRYVMVNIPGAEIEAVEDGVVAARYTGVVGKVDRPSPLLSSRIHELNFNPFWHVPASIVRRDIIPKMRQDPEYLTKFNIRIYTQRGDELAPQAVDWSSDEATNYLLRQDPGEVNSLGSVKINFHNPHAVYLHDTPQQNLFGTNFRFHSSGCVRVQNVRELVTWLLTPNGDWTRTRVDSVIRSGERIDVALKLPTPIFFTYFTAWATNEGIVHFRPDVYNRDAAGNVAVIDPAS